MSCEKWYCNHEDGLIVEITCVMTHHEAKHSKSQRFRVPEERVGEVSSHNTHSNRDGETGGRRGGRIGFAQAQRFFEINGENAW